MKGRVVRNRIRFEAAGALVVGGELHVAVGLVRARAVALLDVRVDRDRADADDLVPLELAGRDLERGVVRLRSVLVDVVEIDEVPGVLHDSLAANLGSADSISALQYRR